MKLFSAFFIQPRVFAGGAAAVRYGSRRFQQSQKLDSAALSSILVGTFLAIWSGYYPVDKLV